MKSTRFVIVLLTVVLGLSVACASLPLKQKIAVTLSASVDALAAFQTTERNLYATKAIPGLTPKVHEAVSKAIANAADAQVKSATVLLQWRAGDPVPKTVFQAIDYGQQTYEVIGQVVPKLKDKTPQERALVTALKAWLSVLEDLAKAFNLALPAWAQ